MNARIEFFEKLAYPGLASRRLLLRNWTANDALAFARLHSLLEVMRDPEAPLSYAESFAKLGRYKQNLEQCGFGRWAVCLRRTGN